MSRFPESFDIDVCRQYFNCDLSAVYGTDCAIVDERCYDCLTCSYFMKCRFCTGRDICTMSPYFFGDDVGGNHG